MRPHPAEISMNNLCGGLDHGCVWSFFKHLLENMDFEFSVVLTVHIDIQIAVSSEQSASQSAICTLVNIMNVLSLFGVVGNSHVYN